MPKIRVTVTAVVEFEPNPEYYDAGATPDQMLSAELDMARDDVFLYLDAPEDGVVSVSWDFKGEVVGP